MDARAATLNAAFEVNRAAAAASPACSLERDPSLRGGQQDRALRKLAEAAAAISPHPKPLSRAERSLRAEMMDFAVAGHLDGEKRIDIACRLDTIGKEVSFPAAWTLIAACADWLGDPRNLQLTYLLHMAAFRVIEVLNDRERR